jgi:uncharacterized protein
LCSLAFSNATKAVLWLLLVRPTGRVWALMAICLAAIPAGVWLGWRLQRRLDPHMSDKED